MTFKIMTDSTADLDSAYVAKAGLIYLGMTVTVDGEERETVGKSPLRSSELLSLLASGHTSSTSQINSGQFEEVFTRETADGGEILYLAFSSGLSGTYQSALISKEMVLEENPKARIEILDTLAAASGEGYLVEEAVKLREKGKTLDETVEILSKMIPKLRSWFMVDDLHHLARGGRIPKTTALVGTLTSIKPILDVDPEGHLRQSTKVRGGKKAISYLIDQTLDTLDNDYPRVIVAHSNTPAVAKEVKQHFLEDIPNLQVEIRELGPVISAHTGAGTIAIFSIGQDQRK